MARGGGGGWESTGEEKFMDDPESRAAVMGKRSGPERALHGQRGGEGAAFGVSLGVRRVVFFCCCVRLGLGDSVCDESHLVDSGLCHQLETASRCWQIQLSRR